MICSVRELGARLAFLGAGLTCSCVVSFRDYPVGELEESSQGAAGPDGVGGALGFGGKGGTAGGSAGALGSAPLPSGMGGAGGSVPMGEAGSGSDDTDHFGEGGAPIGEGGAPGHDPVEGPAAELIDDFEDGDDEILAHEGRAGSWVVSNDGSGTQLPGEGERPLPSVLDTPRGTSRRALRTMGSGFVGWGASLLANLNQGSSGAGLYDASQYTGVRFFAKSGDGLEHKARLAVSSRETSTQCLVCGDHFGSDFTYSGEWREVKLPFKAMRQDGWGQPRFALRPAEIIAIHFLFIDGKMFDLIIDDVGFY